MSRFALLIHGLLWAGMLGALTGVAVRSLPVTVIGFVVIWFAYRLNAPRPVSS